MLPYLRQHRDAVVFGLVLGGCVLAAVGLNYLAKRSQAQALHSSRFRQRRPPPFATGPTASRAEPPVETDEAKIQRYRLELDRLVLDVSLTTAHVNQLLATPLTPEERTEAEKTIAAIENSLVELQLLVDGLPSSPERKTLIKDASAAIDLLDHCRLSLSLPTPMN
jgi:hypothetical protein